MKRITSQTCFFWTKSSSETLLAIKAEQQQQQLQTMVETIEVL
jgi:hypothetical protein